uniref:WxxW domain-containing protein n=1 Tax=Gouania willdenowi TaxID=441366 RepID=A0A8C5ENW2_GOUWI
MDKSNSIYLLKRQWTIEARGIEVVSFFSFDFTFKTQTSPGVTNVLLLSLLLFVCLTKIIGIPKGVSQYRSILHSSLFAACWTQWFDRDDPSGTGDWETLTNLRNENPGKICPKPADIEVETLSGNSVVQTGEVIYKMDTTTGFVCKKNDQPDKKCEDYKVRFRCSHPYCDDGVCWTRWFDRDNPSGTGDWELLRDLRKKYKICVKPLHIEVTTTGFPTPARNTGQKFYLFSPTKGFVCRNKDQKWGKCRDYKVRFGCKC